MQNKRKAKILEELYSLRRFGIKPGIERIGKLLGAVGSPHKEFDSILVVGTNGKGSTASMIASVCAESGLKTGLYTSPHLVDFNERISINGDKIDDETIVDLAEQALAATKKIGCESTFFELTTAMAFKYFADQKVDIAVVEAGMGGKSDATNILDQKIGVITSVDLDHSEYLGDTLEKIAEEKAGIIKGKAPIALQKNPKNVVEIVEKTGDKYGAKVVKCGDFEVFDLEDGDDSEQTASVVTEDSVYSGITLNLSGSHQLENLKTALGAIDLLLDVYPSYYDKFDIRAIRRGIYRTGAERGLRARMELVREDPPFIVDAAHNPGAVAAVVDAINRNENYRELKWRIIFGAMADKDWKSMLKILSVIGRKFYFCSPKTSRAVPIADLIAGAASIGITNIRGYDNCIDALHTVYTDETPTLMIGSFYLIGEVMTYLDFIS